MDAVTNVGNDTSQAQLDIFVHPLNVFCLVENTSLGVKDTVKQLRLSQHRGVLIEATYKLSHLPEPQLILIVLILQYSLHHDASYQRQSARVAGTCPTACACYVHVGYSCNRLR
jgi:hypothetical protein